MIEIINYTRVNKNKVIGLVDIRIPKFGLIIRKIAHLQNEERKWFNFPTYSKDSSDGKTKFYPYVQFELEMHNGKFFQLLSEKLKEYCDMHNIPEPEPLDLSGKFIEAEMPF